MSRAIETDQRVEWVAVSSSPQPSSRWSRPALPPPRRTAAGAARPVVGRERDHERHGRRADGQRRARTSARRIRSPRRTLEDLVFGLKQTVFPPAADPGPAARRPGEPEPDAAAGLDDTRRDDPDTHADDRRRRRPRHRHDHRRPRRRPRPPRRAAPAERAEAGRAAERPGDDDAARHAASSRRSGSRRPRASSPRARAPPGLKVPPRFGTEVVARLLGLRLNHPAAEDWLELLPGDHATRAEAAYSAAQILRFSGWEVRRRPGLGRRVQPAGASRTGRRRSSTRRSRASGCRTSGAARATAPRPISASPSAAATTAPGFVWRVYKLQQYPGSGSLPS